MIELFRGRNTLSVLLLSCIAMFTQCSGSIDKQLEKIAEESNKECPKMLDEWTRLDSCAAYPGKVYKYFHTIVNNSSILDAGQFEKSFKPVIISTIRTNPAIKFFRDNEIILEYQYKDETDKSTVTIKIAPEEYKTTDI